MESEINDSDSDSDSGENSIADHHLLFMDDVETNSVDCDISVDG